MSSNIPATDAAEAPSAAATEFYSANPDTGPGVQAGDPATVDVATNAGSPEPGPNPTSPTESRHSGRSPAMPQYHLYADEDGRPYLKDAHGARYEITREGETTGPRQATDGIPMHHSALFGAGASTREPSSESDIELTPESGGVPELDLDIDPDQLSTHQLSQLNAIRGHLGSLNSRVLVSTAAVAEHQAATEGLQDLIQDLRRDVVSRVDSLRNEANSQRSRLNRVLDDNLRVVKETGASNARVAEILQTMSKNGGANRVDRSAPTQADDPVVAPKEPIPEPVQAAINATLSPRRPDETHKSFERRAQAALRTKEGVLAAFPLPTAETLGVGPSPRTRAFVPIPDSYQSVGSASRAHLRFDVAKSKGEFHRARMLDHADSHAHSIPVAMNNSVSAYASGVEGRRDVLSEFADSAEDTIREIIEGKVGTRVPLPPDVRSPKVAEPHKYRGQDDHDMFTMDFLEKLLGWYRSNNYGGDDLDYYRVVLLQNYLEGDAHRCTPREPTRETRGTTREVTRENTRDQPYESCTRDNPRTEKEPATRRATPANGCYNCGATDHFARDKKCPNYPGGNVAKPRVAAQRVLESYSDEDTDEASDRSAAASEEEDANTAPNLDELIARAEEEEDRAGERIAAMGTRPRVRRFYSMRIIKDQELEDSSDGESSVTASSVPVSEDSELSEGRPPAYDEDNIALGNYNQGPHCVVCHECARVIRSVRATADNGLGVDQQYSVCEHLAHLQHQQPDDEPRAPRITVTSLPTVEDPIDQPDGEFEGYPLNWLGEPDFDLGVIIDITTPLMAGCESAEEEIMWHERARAKAGERPLTALEYDANLKWLAKYRDYTPNRDEQVIEEWNDKTHDELLEHPVYGSGARALRTLAELRELREDAQRVQGQGDRPWVQEAVQQAVSRELGDWAIVHESHLRAQDRLRQAVMTRRLSQRVVDILARIAPERANPSSRMAAQIRWNEAYTEASELSTGLSWRMAKLQAEHVSAVDLRDEARASVLAVRAENAERWRNTPRNLGDVMGRFSRSPETFPRLPAKGVLVRGQENVGILPADEAGYWRDSVTFSTEELGALAPEMAGSALGNAEAGPSNRTMTDAEEYDWKYPGGLSWAEEQARHGSQFSQISNMEDYADEDIHPDITLRASRIEDTQEEPQMVTPVERVVRPISPASDDELVLTSVRMTGVRDGERVRTMVDRHGNMYWVSQALPPDHYLHPQFRADHERAMEDAIRELKLERLAQGTEDTEASTELPLGIGARDRRGIRDEEPRLLPGEVYHERLASLDPDEDHESESPGFRVQFLAAHIEHSGTIRRAGEVGLLDQPTRSRVEAETICSDRATQGSEDTERKPRPKATVEEIPEDEDAILPTLPRDHRFAIEQESEISADDAPTVKTVNDPLPDLEEVEASDDGSESDSEDDYDEYFDAEQNEDCAECGEERANREAQGEQNPGRGQDSPTPGEAWYA
ncbi:hypothetical protein B0H16DRAFT_1464234 [Mycena metata]|uniref:Uncharacterized protein n=1 Tax=Mycena metata TaxID=1033252 RepID=A0AAD7II58_9AGAR|nr:hypothetical protein B0H16DRAFT_1464234 [Mycena metata]